MSNESGLPTGKIDEMINALILQFIRVMSHPTTTECYDYIARPKTDWPHTIHAEGVKFGVGLQTGGPKRLLSIYILSATTDIRVKLYLDSDDAAYQSTLKIICNLGGLGAAESNDSIQITHVKLSDDTSHLMMQLYNACGEAHNKQMEDCVIPELGKMMQSIKTIGQLPDVVDTDMSVPIVETNPPAVEKSRSKWLAVRTKSLLQDMKGQRTQLELIDLAIDIDSGRHKVIPVQNSLRADAVRKLLIHLYQTQLNIGDFKLENILGFDTNVFGTPGSKERFDLLLAANVVQHINSDTYRIADEYVVVSTYGEYIKGVILRHMECAEHEAISYSGSTTKELVAAILDAKPTISKIFPNINLTHTRTVCCTIAKILINDGILKRTPDRRYIFA